MRMENLIFIERAFIGQFQTQIWFVNEGCMQLEALKKCKGTVYNMIDGEGKH